MLPATLAVIREMFDEDEIRSFLLAEDSSCSTVVHSAASFSRVEVLRIIWNFACEKLSQAELKTILLKTLKHGHNIFIKACKNQNENMVEFVYKIASEVLDPEELWKALKFKNYYGHSVLSLTSNNTSRLFPETLLADITNELTRTSSEENILVLEELKSHIKEMSNSKELESLLSTKMQNKTNIQLAAQFGSLGLLRTIASALELMQIDIKKLFLPNLMHYSLHNANNNYEASRFLWSFIVEKLSKDDALQVISGDDEKKRDIVTLGVQINCPTVFEFAEFYRNYDVTKFKDRFFKRNQNGDILIHHVARFCNASMAEKFFGLVLEQPFEDADRKEMLLTKNAFKRTPLHRALKGRNKSTFEVFYVKYKQILNDDGLKRILFHNDLDYFNHGNHKTEDLVDLLKSLASEDFGSEIVEGKVRNRSI